MVYIGEPTADDLAAIADEQRVAAANDADSLSAELDVLDVRAVLLADGYRMATLAFAGEHLAAGAICAEYGLLLADVLAVLGTERGL